jgi:copper(I)-binding protein
MKISSAISSLLVLLPLLDQALQAQAVAIHKDDLAARAQNNNQNNNGGFNNNKNQNQHNQATIGKGKTVSDFFSSDQAIFR